MEYWQLIREKVGKQQVILPSAVGAIMKADQILLVKPKNGDVWHIPGGLQDLNESITQTVERELFEELGVRLSVDKLISIFTDPKWIFTLQNGDCLQQFLLFFLMKGEFHISDIKVDDDEIGEFDFFPLYSLPERIQPCCRQKCEDLMNYTGSVFFR